MTRIIAVILILLVATSCWGQEVERKQCLICGNCKPITNGWVECTAMYCEPQCCNGCTGEAVCQKTNQPFEYTFGECNSIQWIVSLTDSAILCQPYFDLDIPDDIKNSVLWMFCDSIVYAVSVGLDSNMVSVRFSSAVSTDIVYYT